MYRHKWGIYKNIIVTPLIFACRYGYESIAKYLIDHGANVNEVMDDGNTALTVACSYNEENKNENIIKYLIDNGADLNKKGEYININGKYRRILVTPLIIACRYGKEKLFEYFIKHVAIINEVMDDGNTTLIVACRFNNDNKNENIIKYLIDHGADINKKGNQYIDISGEYRKDMSVSPLIIACRYSNETIVKYLVDHGANVNEVMEDGNTALIVACRYNEENKNENIIKYLIDNGADLNKKGEQYVKIYGYHQWTSATPLIIACSYGNENIVKYLIDHGANINEEMDDGNSALTVACGCNKDNKNENTIKYLIDHGADLNKKGKQYIKINDCSHVTLATPLIIACSYRNENIVKYLIDHGANINEELDDGNTALTVACGCNEDNENENTIKYLIDHGADINKMGNHEITIYDNNMYLRKHIIPTSPLIIACKYGYESIVKYLVDHGANVNEVMEDDNTALIIASAFNDNNKNDNIIKYLIDHGADVNKKGYYLVKLGLHICVRENMITPLIIACSQGNENIIKYLIEHGANVNQSGYDYTKKNYRKINHNITSPLLIARRYDHKNIIKYLIEHGAKE